jgi:hypothetical protein
MIDGMRRVEERWDRDRRVEIQEKENRRTGLVGIMQG